MTGALNLVSPDRIERRMLAALELIDPITGLPAGGSMRACAPGFAPPTVTRAGQIVWTDPEPPAARMLAIEAVADRGQFAPYAETLAIPARVPGAAAIVHRVTLQPTGLYEAPAGRLAVAGMLIDAAATRHAVAGASVRIWLQSNIDSTIALDGGYSGLTDARGGFIAVVGDLGDDSPRPLKPPPTPVPDGRVVGWIAVTLGPDTRHSALLPLHRDHLYRAPAPFVWTDLAAAPPALPAP